MAILAPAVCHNTETLTQRCCWTSMSHLANVKNVGIKLEIPCLLLLSYLIIFIRCSKHHHIKTLAEICFVIVQNATVTVTPREKKFLMWPVRKVHCWQSSSVGAFKRPVQGMTVPARTAKTAKPSTVTNSSSAIAAIIMTKYFTVQIIWT